MMGVVPRRLLAFAVATVLIGCSPSNEGQVPDAVASPEASGAVGETGGENVSAPEPEREPLLPEDADVVAQPIERYTAMWNRPGRGEQPDFAFDTHNPFGEKAPLLIEGAVRRDGEAWYEVLLPLRPNGATAWVRANDVNLRERDERIEVDLSKRTLWHFRSDELVNRFRVGVGTTQYPTGTGRFYVWVKVPYDNPNNPYGIMALGLSGFSPVLSEWPGEGRMAVHGTPYASDRGQAVSHGCVRVFNADMRALLDVPLGTPVEITR